MSTAKEVTDRWDNASLVNQQVWDWRLADLPRGENRTILDRLYNGDPPFDEALAEENQIEINRNNLEGPNLLGNARRQWNAAMLKSGNFFNIAVHRGAKHMRREYGHTITKNLNRVLRRSMPYKEQRRQTGAGVMLHGIGPTSWDTRRGMVPDVLPISSILVPSETLVSGANIDRFALFREYTPAQLYSLTHGPKKDPGWQMDTVMSQWNYVRQMTQKQPNATAYQYMPERIEDLAKQDLGFWGSDAVPTIDCWDFYFRGEKDTDGWYRRVILDWGVTQENFSQYPAGAPPPKEPKNDNFLYTSGSRRYANSLNEIVHFNFGDCSAVAPFKYHSVRSLGWMLWGVCDLENRLHCKFNEAVFEQLLWFFRVAGNSDMTRIKKALFSHMGVIPAGVAMVKNDERYKPDAALMELAFSRNQSAMQRFSSSFTQDATRGDKEMTATETMARVNTVNQLVSGMMQLAYEYEEAKDYEICRRACIRTLPDRMAREFQRACLEENVPEEVLNVDCWELTEERTLGAGNKQIEMAQVQFLQQLRPKLGPDAQRKVDHISIESALDDAAVAEDLAPIEGQSKISNSMHDAMLATDRLMRGLIFVPGPDMVYEDYVKVWLADLTQMVEGAVQSGGMASPSDILGWQNMAKTIDAFLKIMESDEEQAQNVRAYREKLSEQMNHVKAFTQRLQQQMEAQQKNNGDGQQQAEAAKAMLDIKLEQARGQLKLKNAEASHAQKTAQRQVQFELDQQREDRRTNAEIRRKTADHALDLTANRMKAFQE
jgi:hypothetical protein